eukprot:4234113-Amphidinium_carterae.1
MFRVVIESGIQCGICLMHDQEGDKDGGGQNEGTSQVAHVRRCKNQQMAIFTRQLPLQLGPVKAISVSYLQENN